MMQNVGKNRLPTVGTVQFVYLGYPCTRQTAKTEVKVVQITVVNRQITDRSSHDAFLLTTCHSA